MSPLVCHTCTKALAADGKVVLSDSLPRVDLVELNEDPQISQ